MRFPTRLLLLPLAAALLACAGGAGAPRQARADPDLLTQAELQGLVGINAKQAIERLRPRFLRTRGTSSLMVADADKIWVYVDGSRLGGVEMLEQIQVHEVKEIRYLSGPDATNRYGVGHTGGAIVLTRR